MYIFSLFAQAAEAAKVANVQGTQVQAGHVAMVVRKNPAMYAKLENMKKSVEFRAETAKIMRLPSS